MSAAADHDRLVGCHASRDKCLHILSLLWPDDDKRFCRVRSRIARVQGVILRGVPGSIVGCLTSVERSQDLLEWPCLHYMLVVVAI